MARNGGVLFIAVLLIFGTAGFSWAYEPVYNVPPETDWTLVRGPLDGNPLVKSRSGFKTSETVLTRLATKPKWLVSGDLNGDGIDEVVVLTNEGALRVLTLDRGNIRKVSLVVNLSPDSPPVIMKRPASGFPVGIVSVDDEGNLIWIHPWTGKTTQLSRGFSQVTYPVSTDMDGDGYDEILGVNKEGQFTVVLGTNFIKTSNRTVLLPDTRITVGDLDGDGSQEAVALSLPTDEFSMERLGDGTEAQGLAVFTWDGKLIKLVTEFKIRPPQVFEILTPVLADVREDGKKEVVVTTTEEGVGSRLRILRYTNRRFVIERTGPITNGNVWIQPIAVSDLGDSDQKLILAVSDPSGKGTLEAYDPLLPETRWTLEGRISTLFDDRIMETAVVGDFNDDDELELVAPDVTRKNLSLFYLKRNKLTSIDAFYVGNRLLVTNLCPGDFNGDDRTDIAVGFDDGTVVFMFGR
jgi:hypothetical protein